MDNLFSNIQQTFDGITNDSNETTNTKSLLDKQRITEQKINDLLEKTSQSMLCGPTCQKEKVTSQLKQKYLDAETNMLTAPIELEQSKKNYFVFKEGRTYYNNMKEDELQKSVNKISELLVDNFKDEISTAKTMNIYLNSSLINSENTKELLEKYLQQNELLKIKLRERHGDILTNDRKTYYEVEALDRLKLWYRFFWWIYYIIVLIMILALVFSPSSIDALSLFTTQLNNQNVTGVRVNVNRVLYKILIIVLLIFYPYYIDHILRWIYGIITSLVNRLPKNVYNDL